MGFSSKQSAEIDVPRFDMLYDKSWKSLYAPLARWARRTKLQSRVARLSDRWRKRSSSSEQIERSPSDPAVYSVVADPDDISIGVGALSVQSAVVANGASGVYGLMYDPASTDLALQTFADEHTGIDDGPPSVMQTDIAAHFEAELGRADVLEDISHLNTGIGPTLLTLDDAPQEEIVTEPNAFVPPSTFANVFSDKRSI
jgi:hypothetical protein